MFDLFRCAFQNLTRKKSRTWLTILSIAVGVTSVILISSIGAIGTQTVNREIDELGIGALTVSSNSLGADQIALGEEHLNFLRIQSQVAEAVPVLTEKARVEMRGLLADGMIWGIDAGAKQIFNLDLQYGRLFRKEDILSGQKICLVDETMAQTFYHRENIVGKKLKISLDGHYETFDIVGVVSSGGNILQNFIKDNKMTRVQLIMDGSKATSNSVTDFLYALSPSQWKSLAETSQFSGFSDTLNSTAKEISHVQDFLGLNIADQPLTYIKAAFVGGSIILAIVAILIPILAWATQMLNIKLMPQAAQQGNGESQQDAMMNSMKTMNMVMPLMSAVFCFTFPVGLGIYWVASAAVRSVQQFIINKKMDKIDIQVLINENMKKMEKKREKAGLPPQKITNQAHQSVKNINKIEKGSSNTDVQSRAKKVEEAYQKASNAKADSITAKANMVKAFDERNKKK